MRLKITRQLHGNIDGLRLGRFAVGEVYDVGTSLANYLLAIQAAEPVLEEGSGPPGRMDHPELLDGLRPRLSSDRSDSPTEAADHKRRPTKRR